MKRISIKTAKMDLEGLETGSSSKTNMKRKRIETSKMDLEGPEKVVQMEKKVGNDNQIARKLLDVVKDVDKSLKKRQGIIDELKVKKGMRTWKAVTFYREVEHRDMEMRQQLMLHINETQMRTFEKREFLEGMKKL
ncbi:hypothetical protein Tco_0178814 [Tanacetum coccineum]